MRWDDGWNDGAGVGWWFVMLIMMAVIWGAIAWVVVTAIRHQGTGPSTGHLEQRHRAEDILAERFARGEIDAEEYQRRIEAIRSASSR